MELDGTDNERKEARLKLYQKHLFAMRALKIYEMNLRSSETALSDKSKMVDKLLEEMSCMKQRLEEAERELEMVRQQSPQDMEPAINSRKAEIVDQSTSPVHHPVNEVAVGNDDFGYIRDSEQQNVIYGRHLSNDVCIAVPPKKRCFLQVDECNTTNGEKVDSSSKPCSEQDITNIVLPNQPSVVLEEGFITVKYKLDRNAKFQSFSVVSEGDDAVFQIRRDFGVSGSNDTNHVDGFDGQASPQKAASKPVVIKKPLKGSQVDPASRKKNNKRNL